MPVFGETVAGLGKLGHDLELLLPAVPHLRSRIETLAADWPVRPRLSDGEEAKFAAFRLARAALAASGTVTLQLGLAGTPMVVAYRVDGLAARFRRLIKVPSVVLANLVLGENAFPEYLQEDCTPEKLCGALDLVLKDTPERRAQLAALERVAERMSITGATPSALAANVVVRHAERSLAALRP
jgi:lipid-A-disaccharide synthase